ncbi:hypothetical protein [Hymenobacter rubidus]|nr:hypothetical protein [Hymenobacter rubidus]
MAFHTRQQARFVAVMRKLFLCYALWKNNRLYDPQYQSPHIAEKEVTPTS